MRTIRCKVAYDGTDYFGWQRQRHHQSIQEAIEKALFKLLKKKVTIEGSGRTDAGVHALGQVFSFRYNLPMPIENFKLVINRMLPVDISILTVEYVEDDFHARYSAMGKTYAYHIYRSQIRDPFKQRCAWQIYGDLDVEKMQEGAAYMLGTHDFSAFMASGSSVKNPVRTLHEIRIDVLSSGQEIHLFYTGNGFLYNMVRIMTGLLIEVGKGKRTPEEVRTVIASKQRSNAPLTAPPQGLFLMNVYYESFEERTKEREIMVDSE